MDFAPYQDTSPETARTLSPPPTGRRSSSFSPRVQSPSPRSPPLQGPRGWAPISGSSPLGFGNNGQGNDLEGGRGRLDEFATSLPIRLDYEACLAYILLPPAGGVLLLMLEHKSDYVRFHAWQSALLFTAIFVLHLIFSWSTAMSWLIFVGDLGLIAFLTFRAYKDADTLDRCEVPFFGRWASRILDDE